MPPQIISTIVGARAEKKAASTAARGALRAGETAAEGYLAAGQQYQEGVTGAAEEIAPWRNVGQEALYTLADEMGFSIPGREAGETGGYLKTPFYQEERADIIDAMEKSAASRGLLRTGGTIAAIGQKAGQYAARGRESYLDRLSNMAGTGYQAASQQARFGEAGAGAVARATEASSAARASSYLSSSERRARGTLGRAESIITGISGAQDMAMFAAGAGGGTPPPPQYGNNYPRYPYG